MAALTLARIIWARSRADWHEEQVSKWLDNSADSGSSSNSSSHSRIRSWHLRQSMAILQLAGLSLSRSLVWGMRGQKGLHPL